MSLTSEAFTGSEPGPHVLITGGVHGDEYEPMVAIRRLIARFREAAPLRGRVTLVPVVNESAFQRGHRLGEDNLDLARTCPGRVDGTPTERAAWRISELIRTADAYIDLHTGGTAYLVQPLVGYVLHPDPEVLAEHRRLAKLFGLPIIWGTDASLNGRTLSIARDAKVPAIYAEYRGGGGCDPDGITAYEQGCLRVLAAYGIVANMSPAPSPAPLLVEDDRPGSGHMQVNHPSPCRGFFTPSVALGQDVEAGAVLGTVTDLLGKQAVAIHAKYAGKVIVLRTAPAVEAGTGVGVVLPSNFNESTT